MRDKQLINTYGAEREKSMPKKINRKTHHHTRQMSTVPTKEKAEITKERINDFTT
ncbi:MAG: hypothetical protein ACI9DJ_000246 [Algoriphagus sp.]